MFSLEIFIASTTVIFRILKHLEVDLRGSHERTVVGDRTLDRKLDLHKVLPVTVLLAQIKVARLAADIKKIKFK